MANPNRMRQALDASGLTQAQVASRLGVAQSAVSQWLTGSRRPDRDVFERFAEAVGVQPVWLDYGVGDGPQADRSVERAEYRSALEWGFRSEPADGSRDYGNANIFSFKPKVPTFVREVLQNVSDVPLTGHARACFTFRRLRGADLDRFLDAFGWPEFLPHLQASIKSGQQVGAALEEGLRAVDSRELLLLEVSDYETTGLLGSDIGEGNFAALCRNNLDSSKTSGRAGGSYGLGKAVLWRMSSLSTVLFLSNLSEAAPDSGNSQGRFIARSELVWHDLDGAGSFAGPGWLGVPDSDIAGRSLSYWGNQALAEDLLLARDDESTGTTISVVGFRDPSRDEEQPPAQLAETVERAVAEHFWPALANGALSVTVQVAEGAEVHRSVDVDVTASHPALSDLLVKHRRQEVVDQLLEPGDVVRVPVALDVPRCTTPDFEHDAFTHTAYVLVRRAEQDDESSSAGQVQYFRGTGMVISQADMSRVLVGAQPFHSAVLCGLAAGSSVEDERAELFLRAAEPPAHNTWEITEKLGREYDRGSGAAIARMHQAVRQAVRAVLAPSVESPSDGPKDLAAMFRLGEPPKPERAPRLIVDSAVLDAEGAWHIEATIRLPSPGNHVVGRPVVLFEGETGSGSRIKWASLTAITDCAIDDDKVVIANGRRSARFRGVTDVSSHPVPSASVRIAVDFRALREAVA